MKEVLIDGVIYVPKEQKCAEKFEELSYVIVRTHNAGVFAGYLKEHQGQEGTVLKARRIWYWKGAATLSQLAEEGVKCPDECKFPQEVSSVKLTDIIEIITCTKEAQQSIASVNVWKE